MNRPEKITRTITDFEKLPIQFPTHMHPPEFWEQLGRTIGTFGFLEEILAKAILVFTGTTPYTEDKIQEAYEEWDRKLERTLTDPLYHLANTYQKAVKSNPASTIEDIDDLVSMIKESIKIRNVLCHGSWNQTPDANGASIPFYFRKEGNDQLEFETPINIMFLKQTQKQVADLCCKVIKSVTDMGYQFPGGS
ncbi:hypothetical protein PsAD2_00414 [Pseudovibrio axinellae]|uniref:RiboL-PSP-HEPN domain-containing protein n=1 Tax=Pseudovibrio axinellae TaxID=989403 RepID=A0A166AHS9_9HYPH|nr:hypothetical protein [Pseudovibrio axinellae]KZL21130.1 hypothetical protein PsAD2_00414 [Pseudovibrio axinellae]SEQ88692.1 hypothetical protein SAMN05421798_10518 [Pseudovibrio axinellae]